MSDDVISPAVPDTSAHPELVGRRPQLAGRSFENGLLGFGKAATEEWNWRIILWTLALVGLITVAGLGVAATIGSPNLIIIYAIAVVYSALRWGRWSAIVSAVASAFSFDLFFIPPYRRLATGDAWYLISLLGLLAIGLLVSLLERTARKEARLAKRREASNAALYALTATLASAGDLDEILLAIGHHMLETFRQPIVVMLPGTEGLVIRFQSTGLVFDPVDKAVADWVFKNGKEAKTLPNQSAARIRFVPLNTWRGTVGVLGLGPGGAEQSELSAFINQAALAVTRASLIQEAYQARLLEETAKLQKALLNSVSHDLRTPLVSISGALDSVLGERETLDDTTKHELLSTALTEARRLNRLVENLLDITRIEGRAIQLNIEPADVQDVVSTAIEQLGDTALNRQISVDLASDLPLVPLDFVLVVQVVKNLLENALKYSDDASCVQIDVRIVKGELWFRVSDRGNGISEHDLEHVFEKFYRGTMSTGRRGSGLGLAICRGFVEAHGGRIWMERRLQGGTVATFALPVGGRR